MSSATGITRQHWGAGCNRDRKSTRLNSSHTVNLVCRLLLEKKKKLPMFTNTNKQNIPQKRKTEEIFLPRTIALFVSSHTDPACPQTLHVLKLTNRWRSMHP